MNFSRAVVEIYSILYDYFGPQHWWPAETPFETIIGAILTQAVSWRNVEKAIDNLREANLLKPSAIKKIQQDRLADLIKPAGYYNMKAKKLKSFVDFLYNNYAGHLNKMFKVDLPVLRKELLDVYGVGPETADSILLYAGKYPIFVIDAYTKRILSRIGYIPDDIAYHDLQAKIMSVYPADVVKYNEYHALLVILAKEYCKKSAPDCKNCPIMQK
ncbi:MAG: endonuclease III domain-containing protein [Firmicutes bacterium]|nr:endonuclease III domain-containing protein [Bacillota bacterium]